MASHSQPWTGKPDEEFQEQDGKLAIWYPRPRIACSKITGRFLFSFAERLMERFDRIIDDGHKLLVCHDWGDVASYDTRVQAEFTTWAQKRPGTTEAVMIFANSPMLRFGVTVTNVTVGGFMRVYDSRSRLQSALAAIIDRDGGGKAQSTAG